MILCASNFKEIIIVSGSNNKVIGNLLDIDCFEIGGTLQFQIIYLDENGYLKRISSQQSNTRFVPKDDNYEL